MSTITIAMETVSFEKENLALIPSPFYQACKEGAPEEFYELLSTTSQGVLQETDHNGWNVLHLTVLRSDYAMSKALIEKFGKLIVNVVDKDGQTPLFLAAGIIGDEAITTLLLDSGACPNAQTTQGRTPLHEAFSNKHQGTAKLLIGRGANTIKQDLEGNTAWHEALDNNLTESINLLEIKSVNCPLKENESYNSFAKADYWSTQHTKSNNPSNLFYEKEQSSIKPLATTTHSKVEPQQKTRKIRTRPTGAYTQEITLPSGQKITATIQPLHGSGSL